jgi:hypothetical protein
VWFELVAGDIDGLLVGDRESCGVPPLELLCWLLTVSCEIDRVGDIALYRIPVKSSQTGTASQCGHV